jgi:hypothetical protein
MIIHNKLIFNDLNKKTLTKEELQNRYDIFVNENALNSTPCPYCNKIGNFSVKGYYSRFLYYDCLEVSMRIKRVICDGCNQSHAILTGDFIPYYQVGSNICYCLIVYGEIPNSILDDQIINRIKKRKQQFQDYIRSLDIQIIDSITSIIEKTVKAINLSYLQIHRGIINLFQDSP